MTEEEKKLRKTIFEKIEQKYKLHFRDHLIIGMAITETLAGLHEGQKQLTEKDKQIEELKRHNEEKIKPEGCIIGKDEFGKDFIAHCGCADCINRSEALLDLRKGYLEKVNKIADLEAQIEKMKCCENCDRFGRAETEVEEVICQNCIDFNNWKLKE